ncbi:MAG TPA: hypothetical protein VI383_00765 [Gemmatimonadales bacterium]|nr:hypothetical protein [Gemmatimonadales bacterium]
MRLHPLFGHSKARRQVAQALRGGRLPQVVLVTGPTGIGKQRFALWMAQLLLCQDPGEEPCGVCRSCRSALGLAHPDLHWFVPIPRPKSAGGGGDADRQIEEAEGLLAEAIAARREQPCYEPADGMAFHSLASVRLLLRRAALTPAAGARKVFVMGEADRLVPQESSPEAANAILKFLEEPPLDTWVLLTASEAERVLPTIRSRVVPIRLSRLSDSEVRECVDQVSGSSLAGEALDLLVRQADGAVGRLAGPGGLGSGTGAGERALRALTAARGLLASLEDTPGARFERALRQPPWAARGSFTDLLDALSGELAERARTAPTRERVESLVTALDRVATAREQAQGNLNPQLLLADLADELAEVL